MGVDEYLSGATLPFPPIDIAPTAAAKPDCIEPAAGNRLADTAACVDHAQPAADKAPTSVTNTLVILIVV